jgi:hypothetical protein
VTGYVRTLRPARLLRGGGRLNGRLLARFARGGLWTCSTTLDHGRDWELRRVSSDEVDLVSTILPTPAGDNVVLERSTALFRYMLEMGRSTVFLSSSVRVVRGVVGRPFVIKVKALASRIVDGFANKSWRAQDGRHEGGIGSDRTFGCGDACEAERPTFSRRTVRRSLTWSRTRRGAG